MSSSNHDKFRNIYDKYSESILTYALRRISPREDAADVVAETFTITWQKIDQVPDGPAAQYWLYAVARRKLSNSRRKSQSGNDIVESLRHQLAIGYTSRSTTNEITIMTLRLAFQDLSAQDREIISLSSWEGLTSQEIAEIVELPAGTVRRKITEIRAVLAKSQEN